MQANDLALLTDAVRGAGKVAQRFAGSALRTWDKPGGAGPVTEADIKVNDYLKTVLRDARPDYGWLSEETEDSAERLSRDTVYIVDPIDGTRSFMAGSATWAHSVAVVHRGEVVAGAVFLPMRDLFYTAERGGGARLNDVPLRVSGTDQIEDANVLASKPIEEPRHWPDGVPGFTRSYRPSLAYRLGLVGQGRFDAMLTFRPTWEWDIAAGALIVEEAHGRCSDREGAPLRFNNATPTVDGMIAANAGLHRSFLSALGH